MPFQAQVFTGELRETLALLRNPTKGLANLSQALSAKAQRSRKSASAIADLWLEFRFGVLPLISDINSIIKTFDDIAERGQSDIFRTKGFHGESIVEDLGFTGVSGLIYKLDRITKYEAYCYISGGYLAQTEQRLSGLQAVTSNLTDLSELPITAWELVPWSFLVDYFVNVGDIIEAGVTSTTSLRYVSVSSVCKTTRIDTTSDFRNLNPDRLISVTNFIPKQFVSMVREVNRTAGLMAIPPLTFTLPGSNVRYANIAALLTSNLTKLRRT